jgi:hypothetical protein
MLGSCRGFEGGENRGDSHAKTRHAKSQNTFWVRLMVTTCGHVKETHT